MCTRAYSPPCVKCLSARQRLTLRPLRSHRLQVSAGFTLTDTREGKTTPYSKPQCTLGSAPSNDIVITRLQVAPEHAVIVQKGKQTFLKPLLGESLLDDSRCWKDGEALRPGVMYVLASGSVLAFGTEGQSYMIEFDEGTGSNPLLEMMMKGVVASSSPEVKKAMDGL